MATHSSPQISVIVPVYKTPLNYFKECLDSLYNQTLQDAEFILVFDGENKDLFSISNTYKEKDDRFKIFIQPHLGVSATRNFGIKQAKGEYITFVDADDLLYSKNTLETSYQKAQLFNNDIILFDWCIGENTVKKMWNKDTTTTSIKDRDYYLTQCIHIQNPAFSGAPWAKFFKRNFILKNNIFFSDKCTIGQDRVFNYKAISSTNKISYISLILYKYIINKESATQRFRPNYLLIGLNYVDELANLSKGKFSSTIGREALTLFYQSWDRDYMNPQNKKNFFSRMNRLAQDARSKRFQLLIKDANTKGCSLLFKIETFLLRHKITFWIYIHGLKRLFGA